MNYFEDKYKNVSLTNARKLVEQALILPIYTKLVMEDLERIAVILLNDGRI